MAESYRGNVTRVNADGVFVEVSYLGIGEEFGPCESAAPSDTVFAPGDKVLVTTVADVLDDVVIVGLLNVPVGL